MARNVQSIRAFLSNESAAYVWLQSLHNNNLAILAMERETTKWDNLSVPYLLQEAMDVIARCEAVLQRWGFSTSAMDAGHGVGHLVRDYVMALILAPSLECSGATRLAAVLAGTFHDIGCALQGRYEDDKRAVRHAEAGAYLMSLVFKEARIDPIVAQMAVLGIAAHTHYLHATTIPCADGVARAVKPFVDIHTDGKPAMCIWPARWVDRCDISGPTFVGRHILTLANHHKDFGGDGFYDVDINHHLDPILRAVDAIKVAGRKRTMLEHFEMFRTSQTNISPYGRFDNPFMQEIRDARAASLGRIINATLFGEAPRDIYATLAAFERFLGENIEPDPLLGPPDARKVVNAIRTLPADRRERWAAGFAVVLHEYNTTYYTQMLDLLGHSSIPPNARLALFGYEVRQVITPYS